jgi:tetratricopeptide (TPR) repeat protein
MAADGTPDSTEPSTSSEKQSKRSIFPRKKKSRPSVSSEKESKHEGHVLGQLSILILVGALIGFLFGIVQSQNRWIDAFNGATIALASAAVGGLLGLLFGVPRALAGSPNSIIVQTAVGPTADGASIASSSPTTTNVGGYGANTNLEQVSDWLTKLLLGAGLTQLIRVPGGLQNLGSYLGPGLGGGSAASPFAVVLVIYSVLIGFFLAFLAARLKLGAAFKEADDLAQNLSAVGAKIKALPDAPLGPTMLDVDQKVTPAARDAARQLSQEVRDIEKQTTGTAFGPDDYRRVAQQLVQATLYGDALQILSDGAKQHPTDPSLPLYTGAIYGMYLGDHKSADANYFKALAINPNYALAYYNLACSAARQDQLAAAKEYLKKAYALDPRLRDRSKDDHVWNNIRDRDDELKDLLPPPDPRESNTDKNNDDDIDIVNHDTESADDGKTENPDDSK